MNRILLIGLSLVATLTCLGVTASAQSEAPSGDSCPDRGASPVALDYKTGPILCKGSFSFTLPTIGGTVQSLPAGCPAFVEVIPEHDNEVVKTGYYIKVTQKVYHQRVAFQCYACGLFWLSTCCTPAGKWQSTGQFKLDLIEAPCAKEKDDGSGTGKGSDGGKEKGPTYS